MPRPVSWLPNLTVIRRSVKGSVRSHYDRRDLELLFKVQPRSAGKLLEILPTVPIGTSRLVERPALETFLDRVAAADDVSALMDRMRTERKVTTRRKLRTLTREDLEPRGLTGLPDWLQLTRGRMVLEFATVEQFFEGLVLVAQMCHKDAIDDFVAAYEPISEKKLVDDAAGRDLKVMLNELGKMEAACAEAPGARSSVA